MERSILFMMLLLGGLFLILDDIYGQARLSSFIKKITRNIKSPIDEKIEQAQDYVEGVKENIEDEGEKIEKSQFGEYMDSIESQYKGT